MLSNNGSSTPSIFCSLRIFVSCVLLIVILAMFVFPFGCSVDERAVFADTQLVQFNTACVVPCYEYYCSRYYQYLVKGSFFEIEVQLGRWHRFGKQCRAVNKVGKVVVTNDVPADCVPSYCNPRLSIF